MSRLPSYRSDPVHSDFRERRRSKGGLAFKKSGLSPNCLEKLSLKKLEGLIDRCKSQDERNIVAAAWGRRLRYLEARSEKRLAKKQQLRLKRMGL